MYKRQPHRRIATCRLRCRLGPEFARIRKCLLEGVNGLGVAAHPFRPTSTAAVSTVHGSMPQTSSGESLKEPWSLFKDIINWPSQRIEFCWGPSIQGYIALSLSRVTNEENTGIEDGGEKFRLDRNSLSGQICS